MRVKGFRTWIEIDSKAIASNYKVFRSLIPKKTKLMAIAKSNAYGHGLFDYSELVESLGVDFIGVDSITEALKLRKNGIKIPILVLGYILPEMVEVAEKNNISITVSNFETLSLLQNNKNLSSIKVHIKVDTGMHRQGFLFEEQKSLIAKLKVSNSKILIEGLYTHFAAAKNPDKPGYTEKQIDEFEKWIKLFKNAGFNPMIHASATSGTIAYPKAHFDMVRIGIGLYGMWPSEDIKKLAEKKIRLIPALSWKTVISEIKKLKKGDSVGYDLTETLSRNSKVALCPIGYWHGYPRSLSGKSHVLIEGKEAKVLGRVSMGMIVVDITDIKNANVGDEVVLIGKSGKKEVSAEMIAKIAGTINYEITTGINPLIKKIYI